jgi:hypothetical protein
LKQIHQSSLHILCPPRDDSQLLSMLGFSLLFSFNFFSFNKMGLPSHAARHMQVLFFILLIVFFPVNKLGLEALSLTV